MMVSLSEPRRPSASAVSACAKRQQEGKGERRSEEGGYVTGYIHTPRPEARATLRKAGSGSREWNLSSNVTPE